MTIKTGIIVAIEANALWVESQMRSTCGSCVAENSCGTGLVSKLLNKSHRIKVLVNSTDSVSNYHINQRIEYEMNDTVIIKSALMMYMVPLITMMIGALILPYIITFNSDSSIELIHFIGMVLGLLFAIILLKRHATKHANNPDYHPVVSHSALAPTVFSSPSIIGSSNQYLETFHEAHRQR